MPTEPHARSRARAPRRPRGEVPVGAGWSGDWLERARRIDSPNHGPRPPGMAAELVVVHSISLPPGVFEGDAVERLFTNHLDCAAHPDFDRLRDLKVSAHFFLRRGGELVQFVGCDRRAWHAGRSSWLGRDDCNDWSIGVELEGLEGGDFTPAQYRALARLMRQLRARYPIRSVAGHEHVAPDRKRDPGAGFDWDRLRRALGWRASIFPAAAPHDDTSAAASNGHACRTSRGKAR